MINDKLKLQFTDGQNSSKLLTIENYDTSKSGAEIAKAMDDIIASGVLVTKNGKITTKNKAYTEHIQRDDIDITTI